MTMTDLERVEQHRCVREPWHKERWISFGLRRSDVEGGGYRHRGVFVMDVACWHAESTGPTVKDTDGSRREEAGINGLPYF